MGGGETLKRRKSQRLAGKKVLKERNGSQTEVCRWAYISCWRCIVAANYGSTLPPLTYIHNVLIILHPKRAVLFRPSAAQAMRTSHEACGKDSSAFLTGLMVSPLCEGAQLQSPAAAGLLWASSPAFLGLTPLAGGLPRPYSSPECTPQQSGSLLFPVQQLFPPSRSPLPRDLSWADPDILWDHLKSQDSHHLAPETDLKRRHPGITATMRSILLDWMLEASYSPSLPLPSLTCSYCTFAPTGV